jgi:hypothetical protein
MATPTENSNSQKRSGVFLPCVYRKLDSGVLMMKSPENGMGSQDANALSRTMHKCVFVQGSGPGIRGEWTQSVVRQSRSATAIAARSVCRECPSLAGDVLRLSQRCGPDRGRGNAVLNPTGTLP